MRSTIERLLLVSCFVVSCLLTVAGADEARIARLEITGTPATQPGPLAWLSEEEKTLPALVRSLNQIAESDRYDGVLIRLKDTELGMTHAEEIGSAIRRVRDGGKRVHVYAEGFDTLGLVLGSYADELILQRGGAVSIPGLHMEEIFLADTLEWLGVKADFIQIGAYKGADEMISRRSPSPEWDENISGLLDSMYENIRAPIRAGRDMDESELDDAMRVAWGAYGEDARRVGLIDHEVDFAEITEFLSGRYGAQVAWVADPASRSRQRADMSNPFAIFQMFSKPREQRITRPTIAVVHVSGAIVDGDSTPGGLFGGETVGSRTIRNALERVLREDLVKGVIVRIESPGGSAIASEVIWQGVRRVAVEKPVWVSVGPLAASGGYYIAVGGDRIYVNPSSIVGSIGVVGGKLAMGGVYDKLRINVVERSRGPVADLFSTTRPWTDDQRELVRDRIQETYDLFVSRVTSGRPDIDIDRVGEGRLFTGRNAVDLGMADEIGGLDDAVKALALELGLDQYDVMDFPGPKSFEEMLEQLFKGFAGAPAARGGSLADFAGAARALLGERRWNTARDALNAMSQLRDEPVLLTMPQVIFVR